MNPQYESPDGKSPLAHSTNRFSPPVFRLTVVPSKVMDTGLGKPNTRPDFAAMLEPDTPPHLAPAVAVRPEAPPMGLPSSKGY